MTIVELKDRIWFDVVNQLNRGPDHELELEEIELTHARLKAVLAEARLGALEKREKDKFRSSTAR